MARQVLIIHGWSDTSTSFRPLVRFLRRHGYAPRALWLGDYVSRDDDVRVSDVAKRMGEVIDARLSTGELDASFDMIVHSTGALVARSWLTTRYRGEAARCPVKRLLMLAPANYGSKLAATGKSFLGRIVKGYDNWFETGQAMLDDLELSSVFQWSLVQRDVLVPPGGDADRYYGEDRVWPFVITGTHPYTSMLRQVVNEAGGDGTVRVCAANLNARGVTLDFRVPVEHPDFFQPWDTRLECEVPLAVLPTRTHGSIIDPDRADRSSAEGIAETGDEKNLLGQLILQALGCADFGSYIGISQLWTEAISEATAARRAQPPASCTPECFHQYFQLNAEVLDDHGAQVPDYYLEFFSNRARGNDAANVYLLRKVIEDVKRNNVNPALRNLYFDRTDLVEGYYPLLAPGVQETLLMSITAASPGRNVHYFARESEGAPQMVPLHLHADMPAARWLKRNTTHFARIVIPRVGAERVFRLTNAA